MSLVAARRLRDEWLPIPSPDEGYRSVLVIGTTGAGKTTLVRQLIGTDPKTERFPSTSASRTTVAETEVIATPGGDYHAIVTFMSRDDVRTHLEELAVAAALAIFDGDRPADVRRALLEHIDQRFRLQYVLGRGIVRNARHDEDDNGGDETDGHEGGNGRYDARLTEELLTSALTRLDQALHELTSSLTGIGHDNPSAGAAVEEEWLRGELERRLPGHGAVREIVDDVEGAVLERFHWLAEGDLLRDDAGWPVLWRHTTNDRAAFLAAVRQFSSNDHRLFGSLLTPLVDGVRVRGPFVPEWSTSPVAFVLLDGEGLGRTPESMASLPTSIVERLGDVDRILLVDNASQPMQAAPASALRQIATAGHTRKLLVCFTHMDLVKSAAMPTTAEQRDHVYNSVRNVVNGIAARLGDGMGRQLERHLRDHCFYTGALDKVLDGTKQRATVAQLNMLLAHVHEPKPPPPEPRAVALRLNGLRPGVTAAAKTFVATWDARLKLVVDPEIVPEHHSRIRALARRYANRMSDEYQTLRPVGDFSRLLTEEIRIALTPDAAWVAPVSPDERTVILDKLCEELAPRIHAIAREALFDDAVSAWSDAFDERGAGAAKRRAHRISHDVLRVAAGTSSPAAARALEEALLHAAIDAAGEAGVRLADLG